MLLSDYFISCFTFQIDVKFVKMENLTSSWWVPIFTLNIAKITNG